ARPPRPEREDDADRLRRLRERARLGLLEQDPAAGDLLVVARAGILLLDLEAGVERGAQRLVRCLAGQIRDRHRAADDRTAEAEPDGAPDNPHEESPVEDPEEDTDHSSKLTRDGTLEGPREGVPTVSSRRDLEPEQPSWFADQRFKKADLHCHSVFSTFKYFRIANTRDSYNRPEEVYRLAKERGMDLVTITDHDSISGCPSLLN